ncbi:hypothetical protein [Bacillus toyonensis]|uniref:hypothetical protein n=1 Tax=Bacillus toyonensis TaxID=155322 RepID=UPI000BFC4733|nr:hypothetical protein [Bacillus toyonensis]PHE23616.1 hypothetical protein COF73_29265 [Bacillus toyonensis]
MYVKTYQTKDVFAFWLNIQREIPVEYDSNLLLEKIKHLKDRKEYSFLEKKLKIPRFKGSLR